MNPLLALFLIGQPQTFEVPVFNRLAMTPVIDGQIGTEEWDHLADFMSLRSYMQWEPGALYLAGDVPTGYGARMVLDLERGQRSRRSGPLEIMLVPSPDGPRVQLRTLQLKDMRWVRDDLLERLVQVAIEPTGNRWRFELRFTPLDGARLQFDQQVGVRVEPIGVGAFGAATAELAPVRLALDRSFGLPVGVTWNPEIPLRTVTPGESINLRLNFRRESDWAPQRVEMRTLGSAAELTPSIAGPFPTFDRRGRAFLDYRASVHENASPGYSVLLSRVIDKEGKTSIIQSSYNIAPQLSFSTSKPEFRKQPDGSIRTLFDLTIRSNGSNSLRGKVFTDVPEQFEVTRGNDAGFLIYHSRGSAKARVDFRGPADYGIVPVQFRVQVGERVFNHTVFVRLEE